MIYSHSVTNFCILFDDALKTHWGRVTHICVGNLTTIGSDNGLSPYRRQAIIWTNGGILLIGHIGTNLSEISIEILTFSFKKMRLKASSAKWRPFRLGLNVLTHWGRVTHACIYVGKLTIISSDNGLSPDRRQVIIWKCISKCRLRNGGNFVSTRMWLIIEAGCRI